MGIISQNSTKNAHNFWHSSIKAHFLLLLSIPFEWYIIYLVSRKFKFYHCSWSWRHYDVVSLLLGFQITIFCRTLYMLSALTVSALHDVWIKFYRGEWKTPPPPPPPPYQCCTGKSKVLLRLKLRFFYTGLYCYSNFMTWIPVRVWFFCHVYYMNFNKGVYILIVLLFCCFKKSVVQQSAGNMNFNKAVCR